jgi:hypothetical protein
MFFEFEQQNGKTVVLDVNATTRFESSLDEREFYVFAGENKYLVKGSLDKFIGRLGRHFEVKRRHPTPKPVVNLEPWHCGAEISFDESDPSALED